MSSDTSTYAYNNLLAKSLKKNHEIKLYGDDGVSFTWWFVTEIFKNKDSIRVIVTRNNTELTFTVPNNTQFTRRASI